MLKDYELLPNGVVRQRKIRSHVSAFKDYKTHYDSLGDLTEKISFLRIGYLLGVIGIPRSLLDFGYGNGAFLSVARIAIQKCYGYEIKDYPIPESVTRINSFNHSYYDVVTFYDSLQYCTTIDFVRSLKCSFVVITVPECHRPTDTEWFINWKHRRPDEHFYHFTRNALIQFMAENGFSCISIGNPEDIIRGNGHDDESNIMTGIFKKMTVNV